MKYEELKKLGYKVNRTGAIRGAMFTKGNDAIIIGEYDGEWFYDKSTDEKTKEGFLIKDPTEPMTQEEKDACEAIIARLKEED